MQCDAVPLDMMSCSRAIGFHLSVDQRHETYTSPPFRPISTGCFAACNAISKTSPALRNFIREVREARTELDAVLAELHSLDGVLDILKDDASFFPSDLAQPTAPLLEHCCSIVRQIEGYMHVCNGLGLSARDKKFRWMAIKGDMEKLRLTLDGYKSTLAVVTDLVGLCVSPERLEGRDPLWSVGNRLTIPCFAHRTKNRKENESIAVDSDHPSYHRAVERRAVMDDDLKDDLTRVIGDMGGLRARLQGEFGAIYAVSELESYLDTMQHHATDLGYRLQIKEVEVEVVEEEDAVESPRIARTADREDRHTHSGSSSVGDAPDSAIDLYDGPPSPYGRNTKDDEGSMVPEREQLRPHNESEDHLPKVEINEFLDEIADLQVPDPSTTPRAPTPPPKAVARSNSRASSTLSPLPCGSLPGLIRPSSSLLSVSDYGALDSEGNPVVPQRLSSLRSLHNSEVSNGSRSTLGSLREVQPPPRGDYGIPPARRDSNYSVYMGGAAVTATVTGGSSADEAAPPPIKDGRNRSSRTKSRLFGRKNSFSVPGLPTRPSTANNATSPTSPTGGAHVMSAFASPGDVFTAHAVRSEPWSYRNAPASPASPPLASPAPPRIPTTPPTPQGGGHIRGSVDTNATSSSGGKPPRPPTAFSSAGASIRSSSSRLSSMFKRVNMWAPRISEDDAPAEDPEPDDIFGVSLKKSMQMASATVKTHHDGAKGGSSRREFPRCVFACVQFIKANGGATAPNIFGGEMAAGGDCMARVARLKEAFSTAPYYGEGNIDWERYSVYDAAELIVMFLLQLRKPLISETVAKRWIALSKQATLPGSMGMRLDECIDFWDEALLGVRGAARSLFKFLLNLLGDIADAADVNDMTAERLASRMLNPLMHLSAAKYTTDFMLGLAFLIRKRSEYSAVLRRDGKKSKAAFES